MHSVFAIFITLVIALILAMLPMPDWTVWLRPAWVLMVLIYWAMTVPYRVSVGVAWFTGIVVDLLNGTLLGEHALAFTIVIYFVSRMYIRLRMYPLLQQGFFILIFVLLYQFILYCIQGFIGALPKSHLYWLSLITSMLLWPWLYVLMRDFRRWFKVA
ncbi:rod shape-determining protein MreD [Aquicella lusitana]|uniref:Rod shape-determining protein MreD n=1 Tax=Aquicella lusitana TaxID=254246 RepID=A0A370GKG2_9COXI|nr:rod shape-determining protein MreD [Aquicella lusitana]RDI42864.1 rod shape-determining protein MreD [Aquicella lusitana]VVC73107.1 Rod shape-determining protein MreD [Aquicella lusitana]